MMTSSLPIAVLDTGAGGLSVVSALRSLLPNEDIHYFADTAHLPYGIKSPELIQYLAERAAKRLIELSSCKILVIACHTISVTCLRKIEEIANMPVIGMVEPSIQGMNQILARKSLSTVGIIATSATVNSMAYQSFWPSINIGRKTDLILHACGPLVSLVEEGDLSEDDLLIVLKHFLPTAIKQSDALLIGCTHFSALKSSLKRVLKPGSIIIDCADLVASHVAQRLKELSLNSKKQETGSLLAYVSDNRMRFSKIARRFIEEELVIEWVKDHVRS